MTVKKASKKQARPKSSGTGLKVKLSSYHDSIRMHLSAVPGVEAAYTWVDADNIVHVVSIVNDHNSEIFDWLMPKERLVEKEYPKIAFDFHVLARQKRSVRQVVPTGSYLVFKK